MGLQEAIEASEARVMKLVSGMLSHLSEEGKRHNNAVLTEMERVRKITHKNGSAAEDMAGGLRELTSVLRENGRKHEERGGEKGGTREEEQAHARERSRAPSPEEREPSGSFNECTTKQGEQWTRQNLLTVSFKSAEGSLCEVITTNPTKCGRQSSPAVTLPLQLSSVQLTTSPNAPT